MELAQQLLDGERRALSRLMTLVERQAPEGRQALRTLYPHTGRAHIIGVTGPPGSGKSTLVNQLARAFRGTRQSIGIVAVDPSSPFSGGALLGDRIRMQELSDDPEIFIRSMATRGASGGLAQTTMEVVSLLDAFGKGIIFVETVGAGQGEVAIARAAHTTVVVGMPGMGDDIQALKAGILEVADVFVINKADRGAAEVLAAQLEPIFRDQGPAGWSIPLLRTIATAGEGIPELAQALQRHRRYLQESGLFAQRQRALARQQLLELLQETLVSQWRQQREGTLEEMAEALALRTVDPYTAVERLLEKPSP